MVVVFVVLVVVVLLFYFFLCITKIVSILIDYAKYVLRLIR